MNPPPPATEFTAPPRSAAQKSKIISERLTNQSIQIFIQCRFQGPRHARSLRVVGVPTEVHRAAMNLDLKLHHYPVSLLLYFTLSKPIVISSASVTALAAMIGAAQSTIP